MGFEPTVVRPDLKVGPYEFMGSLHAGAWFPTRATVGRVGFEPTAVRPDLKVGPYECYGFVTRRCVIRDSWHLLGD